MKSIKQTKPKTIQNGIVEQSMISSLPPSPPLPFQPNPSQPNPSQPNPSQPNPSQPNPSQPPSRKIEFKLVNQGAYGCIYSPEITCDGKPGNPNYISKIQLYSNSVENEISIGKKILTTIHNYEYRFSPILSSCPANIDALGERIEKEECKVFGTTAQSQDKDQINEKKLISTKIKYVAGSSLDNYLGVYVNGLTQSTTLRDNPQTPITITPSISTNIVTKVATTYLYLLESIQKLASADIIHFDIKDPNIIYDVNLHVPIIIDYGISFFASEINTPEKQMDAFYTSKFYPYWCFDIFVLCYIVNNVRRAKPPDIIQKPEFTEEKMSDLINKYITETSDFLTKHAYPLTTEDIELFRLNQRKYYEKFKGKKWEDVFVDLFKPEIYNTWDNYSMAYTYFSLQKIFIATKLNNGNMDEMMKIWKSIILSGPRDRKTIEQTIEEFKKINILEYKPSEIKAVSTSFLLPPPPPPPPAMQMPPPPPPPEPAMQMPPQQPDKNKLEMLANVGMGAVAVNELVKNIDEVDNVM